MTDHMPPEFALPIALLATLAYLALEFRARRRGERS